MSPLIDTPPQPSQLTALSHAGVSAHSTNGTAQHDTSRRLARCSAVLHKCDYWGPPLLYGAAVGGIVAETVQNDELLGLRRSVINALAHPEWVRTVGVAVHNQQGRMAPRDGGDVVPLVGKRMRHPSWNAPGVNSPVSRGRKCAADNHAGWCRTKFGVGIEQNGIAHGKTENADPVCRGKARVKLYKGSDGILVEVADGSWGTTASVTGVVEDNRRYTVVIEEPLYIDPPRNSFSDSVKDQ